MWDVSYPIVVASAAPTAWSLVDTLMLSRFSTEALASVALAWPVYVVATMLVTSWATAVQTLTAQRYGAGRSDDVGDVLAVGLIVASGAAVVVGILLFSLAPVGLTLLSSDETLTRGAALYLQVLAFSLPFAAASATLRASLAALGATHATMSMAFVITVVHVPLSYLFIFGLSWGLTGAAIASSTSSIIGGCYISYYGFRRHPVCFRGPRWRSLYALPTFLPAIWRIGWPETVHLSLGHFNLVLITCLVANLGATQLAAFRVLSSVITVLDVVTLACGTGTAILVGQHLGARDLAAAISDQRAGLRLSGLLAAVLVFPALYRPELVFGLFSPDQDVVVLATAVAIIALAQVPMAILTQVLSGVLRAVGDTRSIMLGTLVGHYVCNVPLAWFLSGPLGMGLAGIYFGAVGHWLARLAMTYRRCASGEWKASQV